MRPLSPTVLGKPCIQRHVEDLVPTRANTIHLRPKGEREERKAPYLAYYQKAKQPRSFLMYRLRQKEIDDKVCEQVEIALLAQVYPSEVIQRCVGQSQPWAL
jgi:membrane-bound lytic murein transglycosylase MltF